MFATVFRKTRVKNQSPEPSKVKKQDLSQQQLAVQLLKKLEFKILRRLDGFLFGDYSGLFYGPSLDLAEVREYQPGDPVKNIDWSVTARTDKVHVRQYREEREIIAWVIVDLSPSMQFGTRRILKSDEAIEFAALASSIITRQGNKVGALGFSDKGMSVVPLRSGRKQSMNIIQSLMAHSTEELRGMLKSDSKSLAETLKEASKTIKRNALIFVISDFLTSTSQTEGASETEEADWSKELKRLAFKHDVIAVRISDPIEKELPNIGEIRLRDPETGEEIWLDSSDKRIRKEHKKLVLERDKAIQKIMKAARVDLLELSTHADIVKPLLNITQRRKGRRA